MGLMGLLMAYSGGVFVCLPRCKSVKRAHEFLAA